MDNRLALAGAAGLGAGLMYLLDPDRGKRRRALVRDRLVHLAHATGEAVDATGKDVGHRAKGVVARGRARIVHEPVDDVVLVERVRAKLGRVVSHPSAISVAVSGGRVTLSGSILRREVDRLLQTVDAIPGVTDIETRLVPHARADDVPGLQGGRPRRGEEFALRQEQWSPTARLLSGAAGGALVAVGALRRGATGLAVGAAGLGLLTRALTNLRPERLIGLGAGHRAVDVQKAITIAAPVEEVYAFWTNYANFPRFMSHVREVRETGPNRSHWVVAGPAGAPIGWDAVVTETVPNQFLAWQTEGGAIVQHSGTVRFEPTADGRTRVTVRMTYNPGAGALGHAVATLFGEDPKRASDEDLLRLKSLLEEGKTSAHGHEVTRPDVPVPPTEGMAAATGATP